MEQRRFNKGVGNENLQKKLAENRRKGSRGQEQAPDIADFMNDMFFGTINNEKKVYNLTGDGGDVADEDDDFDSSTRSTSSRLTQEWLEEAKKLVASSPNRGMSRAEGNSPSRLAGSPRFGVSGPRLPTSDRDPLSRSARRHRSVDGFTGEILTKSANKSHSRNNSQIAVDSFPNSPPPATDVSPVQKWFNNILKPPNADDRSSTATSPPPDIIPPRVSTHRRSRFEMNSPPPPLPPTLPSATMTTMAAADPATALVPPRLSTHRRSRFQNDPNLAQPQMIPSNRTILPGTKVLSPPKHLLESAQRRSISSSTCSFPEKQILSPPRNLVESAQRRSISSSTCFTDKISKHSRPINGELVKDSEVDQLDLNGFLKKQRINILKLLKGEINGKAKIVLSGHSNSTSSMVAAISYAWLLDTKLRTKRNGVVGDGDTSLEMVVPVLNVSRGKMWKQRQAAWLFHHAGVDATAIVFSDEIELEVLMMKKQLSILVVGQEILKTNGEIGSKCTIVTDNYCEDAYDLLQNAILKKIMLAGILLDTQNLNIATTKDTEAARLLAVGSAPNYGNSLYDQLTQEQRDSAFLEALRHNYGKSPNESNRENASPSEHKVSEKKHPSPSTFEKSSRKDPNLAKPDSLAPQAKSKPPTKQTPSPANSSAPTREKGKNPFFLAKWFGFAK
ncbi:putative DHH phosphoesterase superfamily [Helianthus annuus]|nr:putative DHH phosphoesterase superfamily [Helianthus annuus]